MALDLYSKGTTDTLLAAKLDLAGGTMTGGLTLSASGIIFSDSTYLTTAPAGSSLAADQLTAGVVTANPTAGPTASGDVLQYDGAALVWAPGGGGGSFNGGAVANPITIAGTSTDTEMSGEFFGVELTADTTKGSVLYYTGLETYDGSSHMYVNPTGLTFPDATTQSTAGYPASNPDGFQTSTDVSIYVTGLGYLTDAPVDGFAYNRKDGAWEIAGSGGSVAWGSISGTLTDQTDLVSYVTGQGYQTAGDVSTYVGANAYPLSGNPSGFLTSVPGKTVYDASGTVPYTLQASDANNIVFTNNSSGSTGIYVPEDSTYDFPIGTVIVIVSSDIYNGINQGGSGVYVNGGSGGQVGRTVVNLVKTASNTWFFA